MRVFLLAVLWLAFPAHADLYRWVDRETGTVKFSNTPPPWYGDPEKERGAPAVEVLRYRSPGAASKPSPEAEGAAAAARAIAALEARWTELLRFFASLPPSTDFSRAGPEFRQQINAYQALSAELDRLDPAGAQRRRTQEAGIMDAIRRGLQAQLGEKPVPKPPPPQ